MSVEKTDATPEETTQEETQERSQEELEEINPQAAIFNALFNGEEEEEKEEVVEEQTEEVEETEEVTEEVQEEEDVRNNVPQEEEEVIEGPEWAKELDLNNDLVYEAANFFNGGSKPEWVGDVKDMTDEQASAYKDVQRAMSRHANEQNQPQEKTVAQQAMEIYAEIQKLKEPQKITPQPKEEVKDTRLEEHQKNLVEAMQNSDDEAVAKIVNAIAEVKTEQELSKLDIDKKVEELVQSKLTQVQQNQYNAKILREDAQLTEAYGERYTKYVANGSLARIIDGVNPLTGKPYIDTNSSSPVHDAYNYILGLEGGGQTISRPRPTTTAQPPSGSTEGEVPTMSQELMDKSWDEFVKDPAFLKELSKL